ncbi:hypothetical protein D0T84_19935 [Dysgonomonas sp. 521]|uniref:DUF6493 family protein n=1 Tax=Dysgonomonas sp. 521 TaxID=2302932 RepID=UPI0013D2F31B|nr:DUF6493 family protein [Dysgonomonas sp. 521]NDV97154.1 hypothetical protein [Dysgonomonas sp. 521]
MKDVLIDILDNEKTDEIIPFLKSLDQEQRARLVPAIKSKLKEYTQVDPLHKHGTYCGSKNQFTIISIAMFTCFDYKDYKRNHITISYLTPGFIKFHEHSQRDLMEKIKIDDILEWYHPEWMGDFLNDSKANFDYWCAGYEELIKWYDKGYIDRLTPEIIVATLPKSVYEWKLVDGEVIYTFHFEILKEYAITLGEHIWLLFEYPSTICYEGKDGKLWMDIFNTLSSDGSIDRMQLLKETLLTANRNFNKVQTGWFVDLFNSLQPTEEELLNLQPELLSTLASSQSKAVGNAINQVKKICLVTGFDIEDFLGYLSATVSSVTKAIVNTSLDIAEKLMGKNPALTDRISIILCNGFLSKDESIQKKLAKLIVKYGGKDNLKEHISPYSDNILMSVRPLLKDFLEAGEPKPLSGDTEETAIVFQLINDENKIQEITAFDDYLFFLTQAFDNNNPYDVFLIPYYIRQFDSQITSENLVKLEPAFKKAANVMNTWGIGNLDKLYATFFFSYGKHLLNKYPEASEAISRLIEEKNYKDFANWRSKSFYIETYPFYFLLLKTLDSVRKGEEFSLLSRPTHAPLWIDPVELVNRLSGYQGKGIVPYGLDMQLAIQRCALDDTTVALGLAKEKLKGELRDLMLFLFDKSIAAPLSVEHPSWWMTAAITREPNAVPVYRKEWGFEAIPEECFTGNLGWSMKEAANGAVTFDIRMPIYSLRNTESILFSEYVFSCFRAKSILEGDVVRQICSSPYNHDIITGHILSHVTDGSIMDSMLKSRMLNALQSLYMLRLPFTKMDYLLACFCFLSPDKTIRDFVAGLWLRAMQDGSLKNEDLGSLLGKILQSKWGPVKRLTDLIEGNMMNASSACNIELERMIVNVLLNIEEPVTNLKKLLELYSELLSLNKSGVDDTLKKQLVLWADNSTLKKAVKQILEIK